MAEAPNPSYLDYNSWQQQGLVFAPKLDLIDGCKVAIIPKRSGVNLADAVGRGGVKYFRHHDAPLLNRLMWFESKDLFGQSFQGYYRGLDKSPEEWENKAFAFGQFGMEIDEFLEGEWNVPGESEQYRRFKAKRKQRYQQEWGIADPEIYLSYGAFCMPNARYWQDNNGGQRTPTDGMFRNVFSSQQEARNALSTYFAFHYGTSKPGVKYYPESDQTAQEYFMKDYEMAHLMKALNPNEVAAFISSGLIESLPDSVPNDRPGWDTHIEISTARRSTNPAGKIITTPHPNWDFDQQEAMYFMLGLVRGRRIISWDDMTQYGNNPNLMYQTKGEYDTHKSFWFPDVPGTPAPYGPDGECYPVIRLNWFDRIYAACEKYQSTARTQGRQWHHYAYQINDGPWIEPQADGSDVLFNAQYERPDIRGREDSAGNAVDLAIYNPWLGKDKNGFARYRIRTDKGKVIERNLQGSVLHVMNETV